MRLGCNEWEIIRKDGSRRIIEASVYLSRDAEGSPQGFRGICRDITEKRRTQELLLRAERLKAIDELAAGTAHNFNNLLQILIAGAELAESDLDNHDMMSAKDRIRKILQSSRLGIQTVRRLQEFSRMKTDPRRHGLVFDLTEVTQQAVAMARMLWESAPEEKKKEVQFNESLASGCTIKGIESELFEVIFNLVKNSLEAIRVKGEIQVGTCVSKRNVLLTVRDNGVGISKENLKKLFEPFFTTGGVQRTGMGLASSYGIIAKHGGEIVVESEEGKGSTFTVTLPVAELADDYVEEKTQVASGPTQQILLIDDVDYVRSLVAEALGHLGHLVMDASSGADGLALFQDNNFDLVICDLGMPGLTGWQVGQEIKSICKNRGISKTPFILLTGWSGQSKDVKRLIGLWSGRCS